MLNLQNAGSKGKELRISKFFQNCEIFFGPTISDFYHSLFIIIGYRVINKHIRQYKLLPICHKCLPSNPSRYIIWYKWQFMEALVRIHQAKSEAITSMRHHDNGEKPPNLSLLVSKNCSKYWYWTGFEWDLTSFDCRKIILDPFEPKPGQNKENSPGPRLNIKTVLSTYGDFHVKDKTAVRTSYL